MLLQTFWYQIFENCTKTELLRHDILNYPCRCKPNFAIPPPCTFSFKKKEGWVKDGYIYSLGYD